MHDRSTRTTGRSSRRATCSSSPRPTRTGQPQCSYKGGEPGFVRVLDEHTIAFPSYDGNGMYLSLGNAAANPHVGLLFVDFDGQKRLRLNGIASIDPDDPLLAEYPRAQVRRARPRDRGLPELPALHPQAGSSSSARASRRAPTASRRCPTGSGASGRATCSPPATRRTTSSREPELLRRAVVLGRAGLEPLERVVPGRPRLLLVPLAAVERAEVREHAARRRGSRRAR